MLIPHKYLGLNNSIIKISSRIIHLLNVQKILSFDDLMDRSIKDVALVGKKDVFINSINFLYLMGLVDYSSKNDSFFIVKKDSK